MKTLSPMNAAFLRMESARTPMHVGALMTFRLPADAPPDFLHELLRQMRSQRHIPAPFNCRPARSVFRKFLPAWEETDVDMDYHLRHSALPRPGGERELGVLVARLHSHPLDLSRPPWEFHVIEGLEPSSDLRGDPPPRGRFALYFKVHHSAIDGMGAMRLVRRWLSPDPAERRAAGPWSLPPAQGPAAEPGADASLRSRLIRPVALAGEQVRSLADLARALRKMSHDKDGGVRAALGTPRSLFNARVSPHRRLGTQLLDLGRLKLVADTAGATVNDTLLAVCGGAVRRYLLERGALPDRSLLASVPMALPGADGKPGHAVAGFVVPLGTNLDDPRQRLAPIRRVTERSKEHLRGLSSAALAQFALLGLSPLILGQMTGVLPRLPPLFNVVVSNIVLSNQPLYLLGAELEAMYPVSFLFDGYALNVTLVGYAGRVAVGFLGCREAVPHLQHLAVYAGEALAELERALVLPGPAPRRRARKRSA